MSILAKVEEAGFIGLRVAARLVGLTPAAAGIEPLTHLAGLVMMAQSLAGQVKAAGGTPPDKFSMVYPAALLVLRAAIVHGNFKVTDPEGEQQAVSMILNGVVKYLQSVEGELSGL